MGVFRTEVVHLSSIPTLCFEFSRKNATVSTAFPTFLLLLCTTCG